MSRLGGTVLTVALALVVDADERARIELCAVGSWKGRCWRGEDGEEGDEGREGEAEAHHRAKSSKGKVVTRSPVERYRDESEREQDAEGRGRDEGRRKKREEEGRWRIKVKSTGPSNGQGATVREDTCARESPE